MDPASAIIGIVSFGFTVFSKVNSVRKVIKGGPQQLQSLEDSCNTVLLFLNRLRDAEAPGSLHPGATHIVALCETARRALDDVKTIMDNVAVRGSASPWDSAAGRRSIRKLKLLRRNDDIINIARKLKELESTLASIAILVRLDSIDLAAVGHGVTPQHRPSVDPDDVHLPSSPSYPSRSPLRCLPNCPCRCHSPSVHRLIPTWLAYYIGQISISKRLLRPPWSSWSLCDEQTCRGDLQRALIVQWVLPTGFLHGSFQSSKDCRIHFLIGAPRVVRWDSPIFNALQIGDLKGVRDLFATGQASIWDYSMNGMPVFYYACDYWQDTINPREERLDIIRFFVEAGADALLYEETLDKHSTHDALAHGFFTHLLVKTDPRRSLASIIRTNTTAVNIFRPLFDLDPMDALEDYLVRKRSQYYTNIPTLMRALEDPVCNSAGRACIFAIIGHTPLRYAINYSPQSVVSLLEDGEDASVGPLIAFSAALGNADTIKPLLDAGADVNMAGWRGYTALLEACAQCQYDAFHELVRWAEKEIDWNARTANGESALQLFELGVSSGWAAGLTRSKIDEFRAVLVAHMDLVDDEPNGDGTLNIPGAFFEGVTT